MTEKTVTPKEGGSRVVKSHAKIIMRCPNLFDLRWYDLQREAIRTPVQFASVETQKHTDRITHRHLFRDEDSGSERATCGGAGISNYPRPNKISRTP